MKAQLSILLTAIATSACSGDKAGTYQGYVEGEFVHVGPAVAGRLERLLVTKGQTVDVNATLFELESTQEAAASKQADEALNVVKAQLADMQTGKRSAEVDVVRAQLVQAEAAEAQAAQQLRRDEAQLSAGGIARAQVDDSRANLAIKSARVRELAGQMQVSRLPARDAQIRAQEAQVAAARATASQAAWRLAQKQVAATQPALVANTLYRVGEWVPAGSPVVRLLPPTNVKLRFFVPEAIVGGVRPGRKVVAHCDGCASDVAAEVTWIANEPEYTPPVIYSNETRAKLVFLVEARPTASAAAALRAGQPVAVTLQ